MATSKRKALSKAGDRAAGATPAPQLTCFVVTGFGNKTDYATGRVLNLDKTFELLVRPACDAVNVNAFRAIDANVVGSIDAIMYHWIYAADIVIADLSTLNANVFYELGVRHALKPNTTIIIAESELLKRIPFDLASFVVHKYEHGGDDIAKPERERFVALLSGVMKKIEESERTRLVEAPHLKRLPDNPVFTHLSDLTPASYVAKALVLPPAWVPPAQRPKKGEDPADTLAGIIDRAEAAKKAERFAEAIDGFKLAIERQTGGSKTVKPDIYLVQRLALVTYKAGELPAPDGKTDQAKAVAALRAAWEILEAHCGPTTSNDPETLGLAGAIHKRLFDRLGDLADLNRAIWFYERGFYVKRDYYNGINVAYMHTLRSTLLDSRFEAIVAYGHANMVRRRVAEICDELMQDPAAFAARGDKVWVLLTLAEASLGLGDTAAEARLAGRADSMASAFDKQSYARQRGLLLAAMDTFRLRVRPEELDGPGGAAPPAGPAAAMPPTGPAMQPAGAAALQRTGSGQPITIDPAILPGRTVRSIEVTCKVEYD